MARRILLAGTNTSSRKIINRRERKIKLNDDRMTCSSTKRRRQTNGQKIDKNFFAHITTKNCIITSKSFRRDGHKKALKCCLANEKTWKAGIIRTRLIWKKVLISKLGQLKNVYGLGKCVHEWCHYQCKKSKKSWNLRLEAPWRF